MKDVQALLLDLQKYGELHPLIRDVECQKSYHYCYLNKVKERPYPWFPLAISYVAEIENPIYLQQIVYTITEIPFLSPRINYDLVDLEENGTKVVATIEVEGSWLFRKFLAKKMMRAQRKLMKNWMEN